jgi:hypothetical protein
MSQERLEFLGGISGSPCAQCLAEGTHRNRPNAPAALELVQCWTGSGAAVDL